jgi:hypothetical protein
MFAAASLAVAIFAAASAQAATFIYTATSGTDPISASGTLNVSPEAGHPGVYVVNGIDAIVNFGDTTQDTSKKLDPTSSPGAQTLTADGQFIYDNLLYKNAPFVDNPGIEFIGASGALYNLFSTAPNSYTLYEDSNGTQSGPFSTGTLSIAVPEPGAWALMLAGFFGMGAMVRSRRKAALVA